ncbi:MAG: glycosyltransferase [Chloroflexi bacterium]|nr:glycosyltransferase [Chloroflexota bacterium]
MYNAYRNSLARNLARVDGYRNLVIGDTHHGSRPLEGAVSYASSESFDDLLIVNDPHHAHWFASTSLPVAGWWPSPDAGIFLQGSNWSDHREQSAVFIGQVGRWHPRRMPSIEALRRHGIHVRVASTPARIAARLYHRSEVSLNFILNGDTNARIFEIMGSGGTLITDRLEKQCGIGALFTENEHYLAFDGDSELCDVVEDVFRDPRRARNISLLGWDACKKEHLPTHRVQQFWNHIDRRSDALVRNLDYEPRVAAARRAGPVPLDVLVERIRAYEFLQEQVRVRSGVKVFYSSGVEPLTVADSADLSRLHRAFACFPDQAPWAWDGLRALGVSGQVVPTRIEAVIDEEWDLIVVGSEDFVDPYMMNLLTRITTGRIAVAGNGKPIPPSRRMLLSQLGWMPDPEWPSLHVRLGEPAVPEVDAIAPAGAGEFHSSPAPGAIGREPELSRTSEIGDASTGSRDALALAHDTVAKFDWQSVAQYLPSEMNALVATGIVRSLVEARPVDGRGRPVPAFVHGATDFVEPFLRPEWRVLIWGSGADLKWWSSRVAKVAAILAPGAYDPGQVAGVGEVAGDVRVEPADSLAYTDLSGIDGRIDVAVIGGEEPARCANAVLGKLSDHGLVIVENADRAACAAAIGILGDAGWRRIDFWGILPQYLFQGCTSIFFKDERYVNPTSTPDTHQSSFGPSFAQITGQ